MSKREWGFRRESTAPSSKVNPFGRDSLDRAPTTHNITTPKIDLKSEKSVFVSYARNDLTLVQPLVTQLRQLGINVVWDQDIPGGVRFDGEIRSSIERATAVLVVWGPASIFSDFVLDEASLAKRDNKLLPLIADDLSVNDIPLGFGRIQTIALSDINAITHALAGRDIISPLPPTVQ